MKVISIEFGLKNLNRELEVISFDFPDCEFQAFNHCAFVAHWKKTPLHQGKQSTICFICSATIAYMEFMAHLQSHKIAQIQCIYCHFGCNSIELMRCHLMDMHPTELPYSAGRLLHQNTIDSMQIIRMSQVVEKHLLCSPPLTERQMNFMRPALDQYDHNAGPIPNDDAASVTCESMDEVIKKRNQQLNEQAEKEYNISTYNRLRPTNADKLVSIQPTEMKMFSTSSNPAVLATGDTTIKIAHVASGVEMKNPINDLENEIEAAARSIVVGTGFDQNELFRCSTCRVTVTDELSFLAHLAKHLTFTCIHCQGVFQNGLMLKNHIKIHAVHQYFCYCCNATGPIQSIVEEHARTTHNCKTVVHPLIANKQQFYVVCPSDVKSINDFAVKLIERNKGRMLMRKKYYSSDEADMLPRQQIYTAPVFCKMCSYNSKVRANIHRHLVNGVCTKNLETPEMDPVNPVPCLDTGEKYFDKMKNLAASSNVHDHLANDQKFQFVNEERRFVCGAPTCHYQTQTEEMLRGHIDALHRNDRAYHCTHCNTELCEGKFISANDVLNHLRFHDSKLFKCPACTFLHFLKAKVDKHIEEEHPRCKDTTIAIQRSKSFDNATRANKASAIRWKCNICMKTSFDTRAMIKAHMQTVHRLSQQYQCQKCSFQSDIKSCVKEHIQQKHGVVDAGNIEVIFERIDSENDVTPIWRRDDPNRVSIEV